MNSVSFPQTPPSRTPRPRRRRWWLLGTFFGLLAAVVVAEELDAEPGSWLLRTLLNPGPGYYELSVDLTVEGVPLTVKRVMECKPYSLFYSVSSDTYINHFWYAAREAMTHRLPSGAGIIVVAPRNCGRQGFIPKLPADYIPLIAWVDNADDPSEIEAYFAPEALERPNARVRFHALSVRVAQDFEPQQSRNEFGLWQNGAYTFNRYLGSNANWFAIFAGASEEEEWRAVPSLGDKLSRITTSQVIEGDLRRAALREVRAGFDIAPLMDGEEGIQLETRRELDDLSGVVPFRRKGQVLAPSFSDRGTLIFYKSADFFESGYIEQGNVPFEISGRTFNDLQVFYSIYFDVEQRRLYNITGTYIRFTGGV